MKRINTLPFLRADTAPHLVSLSAALLLSACVTSPDTSSPTLASSYTVSTGISDTRSPDARAMYAAVTNEQFALPAVDLKKIEPRYYRRRVDYDTSEKPGTVIVDTQNFFLYLVEKDGKAMRYGVGLGRAGFEWSGRANIAWKRKWPTWTPPDEMIEREPDLEKYSARNGGMEPGPENPLGARALYIFQNGEDTLYRLHGTAEDWSIGRAVSSGCVRLLNQDIIDLYERVPNGAKIVVI